MITFSPLTLLVVAIVLGILFHIVMPKGTTKNTLFIYCIVGSAVISGFGALLNSLNHYNESPEYISTTIGTIIGSAIAGGLIGGAIGYNLGNLLLGKKFTETKD